MNVVIYCKYTLRVSGLEVIYLYLSVINIFLAIHSSLTFKGHRTNTPSLKTLVSAADLQACQLTLLDSIGAVFRTQSSFYNEVFSRK